MGLRKAAVTDTAAATNTAAAADTAAAAVESNTATPTTDVVSEQASQVLEVKDDAPAAGQVELQAEAATDAPASAVVEDDVQPETKPVASTAVATQQANTSVVASQQSVMQQFTQELADSGFEGMEVTGLSFERIRLHEGKFKIGQEDSELGLSFKCQILRTRPIYVVRQDSSQDAEMFYSYDPAGQLKTDGTSAEDILADWRGDGFGIEGSPLEIKEYREVMATLKGRDDEYDEMVVSLSVPPASVDRLAGVAFTAKQKYRCLPDGVITECKVGKEVGEGSKKFRPWIFKVLETVAAFEAREEAAE